MERVKYYSDPSLSNSMAARDNQVLSKDHSTVNLNSEINNGDNRSYDPHEKREVESLDPHEKEKSNYLIHMKKRSRVTITVIVVKCLIHIEV